LRLSARGGGMDDESRVDCDRPMNKITKVEYRATDQRHVLVVAHRGEVLRDRDVAIAVGVMASIRSAIGRAERSVVV
jgi:hypothetical protein